MRAGLLDTRVTLQSPVQVQEPDGAMSRQWATAAVAWASVRTLSGMSVLRAGTEVSSATVSVRIRPLPTLPTAGQRVTFNGRVLDIRAVLPGKAHIDLVCAEGANDG